MVRVEYVYKIFEILTLSAVIGVILKLFLENIFIKGNEKFKNNLQIQLAEFNIKNSKLHNDRAEVVKTVYSKIVIMGREMKELVYTHKEERVRTLITTLLEAKDFFEENRIFFDEGVVEKLDHVFRIAYEVYFDGSWNAGKELHEIPEGRLKDETSEKRLKAFEKVMDELPEIKKVLEDDFRRLLGVQAI